MTKNGFKWKHNWNRTIRFKIHQFWLIYHLLQAPLWIHCMTDHSLHCYNCQQYSIWIENMLNRQSFLLPNHTFDCSHFLPFGSMLLKLTKMNTNDVTKAMMNNEYDQLEYHDGERDGLQWRRCFLPMPPFLCLTTCRILLMQRVSDSNIIHWNIIHCNIIHCNIMHCITVRRQLSMAIKSLY